MTTSDAQAAINSIRAIFSRTAEAGWKPDSVVPATDAQIDEWARAQGCEDIPVAVREVLRVLGTDPGIWLKGSSFGIGRVTPESKNHALATISQLDDELFDSSGMLVMVDHQAYLYNVIDGADLEDSNPPVWIISEGQPVRIGWPSVTTWLDSAAPSISDYRSRLKLKRQIGKDVPSWWGKHFDLDRLSSPE
ncbi:hypothetical protein [Nocardia goodfellowii]|uniref:SMI1/KNR4 family protein n=1 Tax=Nocardia goodfellowii TaxID=882446 RepID=A0ABS4QP38_9NOCA|nr:hypothetical protein [Nocardia goodfellowii]MBP2193474.1 hypothetical protein [Nocardia goodfellowii]